ncbi:unnamed protein product [Dicrocoelium dendriticum]|nr:unnamed protein product [Dicrocoelium dendriticum]CAI2737115.1 unnamed protein product [Dicrocoelium dendriticum]
MSTLTEHLCLFQICREEFIALHSEPILHNFAEYLRQKFAYTPDEISQMSCELKRSKALSFNALLDRVPKAGTFDLNEVRNSTYFFS